jgi:ribose 5-phosphate isomerase A
VCAAVAAVTGVEPVLRVRSDGETFVSDNGNFIIDCRCGAIPDPTRMERELKSLTGVVESGLFVRLAHSAIVATETDVEIIE